MAQLPTSIDCSQELPSLPTREPLPEGDYTVHIIEDTMKPTKKGDGEYLELKMEVLEGSHKGRWLFDRLNLRNPNKTAVEISERTLVALGKACGIQSLTDSSQLRGIPITATVKVKQSEAYGASNDVSGYSRMTKSAAAPATAAPSSLTTPPWGENAPF
jgi:hypothetical protein